MKSKLLVIVFILISSFGFSQKHEISGKVMDGSSGVPLPGVNITVKNTSQAIATDVDGKFKFSNVSKGSTLVFSYIGYQNFELKVTQSQEITVSLKESKNSLDEVVVIGYGSIKKKDLTGSVAVISSKTIENLKPVKVEQALQGTVAGVNVTSQSGSPGSALDIRIRGIGTNVDNTPTAIIDGYIGNISLLSPSDIESITVLKDAQAAIYGSIGANGVILVTTKSGKRNSKTRVAFNSSTGFQQTSRKLPMLNSTEYALLLNESYANGGNSIPFPNVSNIKTDTDWQDEVFKTAPILSNDFSISGGSEKVNYAVSASSLSQQGIVGLDKSGFQRKTARLALGADLTSKIKINTNIIYTHIGRKTLNENGLGSVLFNAINTPSILSVYDENGNYTLVPSTTGFGAEVINPLAQIENTYNDFYQKVINGSFKIDYEILKNIKLTSSIGFTSSNSDKKEFFKEVNYGNKVFNVTRSSVNQNKINDNDYTFDLYGTYSNKFFENHNVKFTLGLSQYKVFGSGLYGTGYDVPNNSYEFADLSLTKGTPPLGAITSSGYEYSLSPAISQFARLEYDFKGKYLFSFMQRRDVSARFGSNNRVAYFPSVTAGWVVTNENFLNDNSFINFMKIRGSYGLLGNNRIGDFKYIGTLSGQGQYVFNNTLTAAPAIGVLPNPNIKWEADKKLDIGLDLKLLNSKIEVTADYFDDTRKDLLIEKIPVSGILGIAAPGSGAPTANAGTVKNSGLEFAIDYKESLNKNLNFKIGYNVAYIKNKVTEVNNNTQYIAAGKFGITSDPISRMEVGHAMGYFYGYQADGIFQNQAEIDSHPSQAALGTSATAPGDIRYKDVNGDGFINANDKTDLGNPIPKFTMGFNFTVNYKNFDFLAYTYASIGNKGVRAYERVLSDVNKLNYALDRWTGEGTSNSVPRVTNGESNNNVFSSYFVEDASFLRLQNIQLGYTLTPSITDKFGISKVHFYTSVQNAFTFTKYRGYDPSASNGTPIGSGIDNGFYPNPRTYTLGVNINF